MHLVCRIRDITRLDRLLIDLDHSLAYAEIYLGLAILFRRFELELYETDRSDVDLKHDFFVPVPKLDSKGVRVLVK